MPRADKYGTLHSNTSWQGRKRGRPRRCDLTHPLQKVSDDAIAAVLNATDGIIKDAAPKLGMTYHALAARIQRTPILRQLCESFRMRAFDFTETHLRKANKRGEQWAIKEMLRYRGHRHGYTEKQQTELSGAFTITHESLDALSDEELDALLCRLDRRIAALATNEGNSQEGAN